MELLPLLLSVSLGLSIFLIFVGLALSRAPSPIQERLAEYGTRPMTLEELELSRPFSERVIRPMLQSIVRSLVRFTPKRTLEATQRKLEIAGNPYNWTPTEFMAIRMFAGLLLMGLTFLVMNLGKAPAKYTWGLTFVTGLLGYTLPLIWLNRKIKSRKKEIIKTLPDALDLITISVEAGLGFDAAMAKVTERWDNELSKEFARTLAEMRLGKSRQEALRDMANRIDVPEVSSFVAAVIQADALGVSIAKVMRIQSDQMRIRRRQRAEELAQKAPVKLMIPLVLLIFPSIWIVILGPAILMIKNSGALGSISKPQRVLYELGQVEGGFS